MSARPSLRNRWLVVLDATPYEVLACCPKYTLRVLADYMRDNGYVTPNRAKLAARLGCSERTIDDHFKAAREADLLAHVSRAHKGRYATYRAMIPDSMRALQYADRPRAMDDVKRAGERRADGRFSARTTRAPTTETQEVSSATTSGAVDGSGPGDDATLSRRCESRETTAERGTQDQQLGMRGRGATEPQGSAAAIVRDSAQWCRSCGGWLRVAGVGTVVDGRCEPCQRRRAERDMKITYEGSAAELARYAALTASAAAAEDNEAPPSELPANVAPFRREDRKGR